MSDGVMREGEKWTGLHSLLRTENGTCADTELGTSCKDLAGKNHVRKEVK